MLMCVARGDSPSPLQNITPALSSCFSFFYLNKEWRKKERKKAFWVLEALVGSCLKKWFGFFLRMRWGSSQIPAVCAQPHCSRWGLILGFSGGWVPANACLLWVWHPHGSLYIPAASVCSKTLILDLLQAQRNVCVFSMSG